MKLPPTPTAAAPDARLAEAARQLEAVFVKSIVSSSGAFRGGESPGSAIRADLFAETLADAVSRSGGLGVADAITRSLSPAAAAPVPGGAPDPGPRAAPAAGGVAPLPVDGRVTSPFGLRGDPFTGAPRLHRGVDVGAPEGAPIRATAAGVVRSAGTRGGYGEAVELDHGGGLSTLYGHASELLVAPGESVAAGQVIARVGSTGRSTGPHLHFEVRKDGRAVDPAKVLQKYAVRADDLTGAVGDRWRTR